MDKNGYFKILQQDNTVYLTYIQKQGKGTDISCDNLKVYLEKKGISYGTVPELKKAMEQAKTGARVKISETPVIPFSGWCEYSNQNYMRLTAIMYPPIDGKPMISKDEILGDLKHMKVVFGIKSEMIDYILKNELFCTPFIVAEGLEPVDGCDAVLTYNFNTEIKAKPTINDDGSVDFHHLDMINHVKEGDVVAEIKPEDPGKDGKNIMGMPVKPKKVQRKIFKYGRNLVVSEDGTKLISQVTGHVTLEGDKIFVSNEYEVKTDVDNSTGDIEYDGNIKIYGNVRAGFKVKATGNITVNGVVEGAELTAGGDIILQRGILGMNRGILRAGGNVVSTYIENATIYAQNNLEADAVLHSKVTVNGTIDIHGKNGYIIGGEVRAGSLITAKIIGSAMETNTVLAVGTSPELMEQLNAEKSQIASLTQDRAKLTQIVDLLRKKQETEGKLDAVKTEYLQKTMKNLILVSEQLTEAKNHYVELSSKVCEDSEARIKVMGSIHPGVKLEFGDQSYFVREKNDFCQYVKKGVDITRINM